MTEDIIRSLGYLTLGSRLKRIGELLQADATRLMESMAVPAPSSQHPLLAALDRSGPLAIGALAQSLGVAQPGVTRTVAHLAKLGLVEIVPSAGDQRRTIVALTAEGRRVVARAKREVWPQIEAAVADLCQDLSGPLLEQLAAIEDGLAAQPLVRRAERNRTVAS